MANSKKLCRLVRECGKVCERRMFRVNIGKCKVMRWSRYGNVARLHVRLNGEPLEEVDYLKYLMSQVAADGGCERDALKCKEVSIRRSNFTNCVVRRRGMGYEKC